MISLGRISRQNQVNLNIFSKDRGKWFRFHSKERQRVEGFAGQNRDFQVRLLFVTATTAYGGMISGINIRLRGGSRIIQAEANSFRSTKKAKDDSASKSKGLQRAMTRGQRNTRLV